MFVSNKPCKELLAWGGGMSAAGCLHALHCFLSVEHRHVQAAGPNCLLQTVLSAAHRMGCADMSAFCRY
jgi:hypothetical protein